VVHAAGMREMRYACILARKSQRKGLVRRPTHIWKNNSKMDLREIEWETDLAGSG